jgi:hypothetical protein
LISSSSGTGTDGSLGGSDGGGGIEGDLGGQAIGCCVEKFETEGDLFGIKNNTSWRGIITTEEDCTNGERTGQLPGTQEFTVGKDATWCLEQAQIKIDND